MYVHIDFGARAHEETSPRLRSAESTFIRRVGAQHASTTTGFDNKHCILTVGTVGRGPQTKEDQIVSKEKTVVLPEKDRRCCNYRTHTREYPWHKAHKREAHRLEYISLSLLFHDALRRPRILYRRSVMVCHLEKQRSMISAHALRGKWSERTRERRVNIESKTTSHGWEQEDAAAAWFGCHRERFAKTLLEVRRWRVENRSADHAGRQLRQLPARSSLFLPVHPRDA